jgi:hypothetical protein
MENTRYAHKKDVKLPFKFINNHTESKAQLYGSEVTNNKQRANPNVKIGYNIAMSENYNHTQNKTNLFRDSLYIQSRPVQVRGNNYVGLKVVRPPPEVGPRRWTFNTSVDSSMKATFSSYLLPRDRTLKQFTPV